MRPAAGILLAVATGVAASAGCASGVLQGRAGWQAEGKASRPGFRSTGDVAREARSLPGTDAPTAPAFPDGVDIPDWSVRAAEMVQKRVIVYTADYQVAVANPQAAISEAEKLADELGGYVQTVTAEKITIRVPADKFRTATGRIERLGQLIARDVRADDITEEYVDLQMRLASGQTMLQRLKVLLEKAPDARQALEVEREIARVMTEIERLQGRIRLLENQVALSTIRIQFMRLAEAPRPALLGRRLPFDWLRTLGINVLLDY